MNMSWIYEAFSNDFNMDIEFKSSGEVDEEYYRKCFEEEMEKKVNQWIMFKVFRCGDPADFDHYDDSIWDYIHDAAIDYQKLNPRQLEFTYTDTLDDCSACKLEVTTILSNGLCPDCDKATRGASCIECDRLIEVEGSQHCNRCRPCECGECDEIGGTCDAQTAKYKEEEA